MFVFVSFCVDRAQYMTEAALISVLDSVTMEKGIRLAVEIFICFRIFFTE